VVTVRLPDGRSLQRRWLGAHTVQQLAAWVHAQGPLADGAGAAFERFRLVLTHPARVFAFAPPELSSTSDAGSTGAGEQSAGAAGKAATELAAATTIAALAAGSSQLTVHCECE
jgi:hypothetical protein